jgi:hypothetical protein
MALGTRTHSRTTTDSPGVPRDPVLGTNHPLGSSQESEDIFTGVGSQPTAGKPPQAETVNEGEDDQDLTDRDEALSDGEGEEGSLYGGGSEFGPPTLADLIDLGHSQCRAPTQVTTSEGAKVLCVCGRSVEDCKRHARHRISGCYRHSVGFYVRMTGVCRGFQGHGLVGTFYTQDHVQELRRQDLEEMDNLMTGMTDGNSDDEDRYDASPSRGSFGPTNLGSTPARNSPKILTATQLRDELVETTRADNKKKTEDPPFWYRLVDVAAARWIFQNLEKAQEYVDTKVFCFARIFESEAGALTWRSGGQNNPLEVPPSSIGDDDSSDNDSRNTARHRKDKKKKKKKKKKLTKKSHERDKKSPGRSPKKGKRRKSRRPPTPPSSSSKDSSSSSDSDSSTDSEKSKRSKRKDRRKEKQRLARGLKSPKGQTNFTSSDPSVGDGKRIFDLSINGAEVDKAAGPTDMRRKDATELYIAAVDVTSLPGMFSSGTGRGGLEELYEEAQRTTQFAATLLPTAIGKRAQVHDSLWKTTKRHSMGVIKSMETLFSFVKSVGKAEKPAFEQQENAIQVFMLRRHYDDEAITKFSQNGFLPRLTQAGNYGNMLSIIRQLAFDHPNFWDQGPAKAMLDFHSDELLQIWQNSLTQKALILQTYLYLRDASSKGFYHESMTESLWDRLSLLSSVKGNEKVGRGAGGSGGSGGRGSVGATNGGGTGGGVLRCSHCCSPKLHELAKVRPSKQVCPVKDFAAKKAKAIAKPAVEKWET